MDEAAKHLRKVADLLQEQGKETIEKKDGKPSGTCGISSDISKDVKRLFSSYPLYSQQKKKPWSFNVQPKTTATPASYWTHKFCCLYSVSGNMVPEKEEKKLLFEAGLGEKKVTFIRNESTEDFVRKLEEIFPKLVGCGGFELLRTAANNRKYLEVIKPGKSGYSSEYLCNSYLGQACCFIRPVQEDLDPGPLDDDNDDNEENQYKVVCKTCEEHIVISQLRKHVEMCKAKSENDMQDIDDIQKPPFKRIRMRTGFEYSGVSEKEKSPSGSKITQVYSYCPVCSEMFPEEELAVHASGCGDNVPNPQQEKAVDPFIENSSKLEQEKEKSFEEIIESKRNDLKKEEWEISVIRRIFIKTAMKELEDAQEIDWKKKIKTEFIGEEGVDSGGLSREFFSLLFKQTPVFENGSFSLMSELLEKRHYFLLGKITAMGIIHGHPGPHSLNDYLVDYILQGKEPDCSHEELSKLREDAAECVREIDSITEENTYDIMEKYAEILDCSGFHKILNKETKVEASRAVVKHFTFFRCLPPLLQYMDGLKLHGILALLQKHPAEGKRILQNSTVPSYQEVKNFFRPVFSDERSKKELEEVIVFNFGQFLKNVERQKINSDWFDLDNNQTQKDVTINMKHVLQAFVGSEYLPSNLESGLITFDHDSTELSTINTCAPSITITQIPQNQNYNDLENHLLNIILRTDGFGMA